MGPDIFHPLINIPKGKFPLTPWELTPMRGGVFLTFFNEVISQRQILPAKFFCFAKTFITALGNAIGCMNLNF